MEFPNKPWAEVLDEPAPEWAMHQIDYTGTSGDSHSVWVSPEQYQFFRSTQTSPGAVMTQPTPEVEGWTIEDWAVKMDMIYCKITDLQPIVENE